MARIYTLANQKGGVGKTTTAINLGAYLAYFGQKVLLVDLDPQSNATSCLKIDKYHIRGGTYDVLIGAAPAANYILHNPRLKISLLPASPALAGGEVELVNELARESRMTKGLQPVLDRYDYILIDCPPSLGLLTLNGLVAAQDGLIIPVQCEYLALEGLSQLTQTIDRVREALFAELIVRGVVMTMYDGRTTLANEVVAEVRHFFGTKVFQTVIPRSVRLAEAPSYGQPISMYAPSSPGALAYSALAREILVEDGVVIPTTEG
jgi:chromosome partitioning protein